MNLNLELPKLLDPMFNTLNSLIENYGIYLFLVFVWLALATIAWIFSGGLRRRMKGNVPAVIPVVVIMAQSPREPEPPIIDIKVEQTRNDDGVSTK